MVACVSLNQIIADADANSTRSVKKGSVLQVLNAVLGQSRDLYVGGASVHEWFLVTTAILLMSRILLRESGLLCFF